MQHGDEIAAGDPSGIAEDAVRRWTQAEAIPGCQVVNLSALPELQNPGKHHHLLILDEGIGRSRISNLRARRQLGLYQLQGGASGTGGRECPALEASRGIAPDDLLAGAP